jgi:hypothetical protein
LFSALYNTRFSVLKLMGDTSNLVETGRALLGRILSFKISASYKLYQEDGTYTAQDSNTTASEGNNNRGYGNNAEVIGIGSFTKAHSNSNGGYREPKKIGGICREFVRNVDCPVSMRRLSIDEDRSLCHRNRSCLYDLCSSHRRTLIVTDDHKSCLLRWYLFDGGHVFSCLLLCCIVEVPVVTHARWTHNDCWEYPECLDQSVSRSRKSWGCESDEHVLASHFGDAVSIVPRSASQPKDSGQLMTVHVSVGGLVAHQREWFVMSRHRSFHHGAWRRKVFVAAR